MRNRSLRVGVLGPLQVTANHAPVEIGGGRLRRLLIRLALEAGRVVSIDALFDAVWPDDPPSGSVHALQSLVTRLRRALPEDVAVRGGPDGYCLELEPEAVDATRFERLVRGGRQALRDGDPTTATARLREALELWRGEPLAEAADAPYMWATVTRLREARLSAIEERVAADLRLGVSGLASELEPLIVEHPWRERLRALLLRSLHADGRATEVLAAYERYRSHLVESYGSDPGPELQDAYLAVLRAEPSRPATSRGNLPVPTTSFVGRIAERATITEQLRDGRLVTLTGAGGAGKTRLATTVAAELIADGRSPGGAWLIELTPVSEPAGVPLAIAEALGLREPSLRTSSAPSEPIFLIAEALAGNRAMLVLDNCEHLIDAVAEVVQALLARSDDLRLLLTSREPLGIPAEQLCPVPALGVPDTADRAGAADTADGAVRLFADRAAAVRPDFVLDERNRAAVVEICRRLDGLPLAIELTAARLRTMSLERLSARLEERFWLLGGSSRMAFPRHRTLRAVVGWSWDLLDEAERTAIERVAVFAAGFGAEAAARLGVPPISLDTLDGLVEKSLLQTLEVDGAGEARFRMLETIREYALERLAEDGRLGALRSAHAAYFLDLAERAGPALRSARQVAWVNRLIIDRENLLAALRHFVETGDRDSAVRLGAVLGHFWAIRGEHPEAVARLGPVLDLAGVVPGSASSDLVALYLLNAWLAGQAAATRNRADELRMVLGAGRDAVLAEALLTTVAAGTAADSASSREPFDRSTDGLDDWTTAMLLLVRTFWASLHADVAEMRDDLSEAVEVFRKVGDRWGMATSLTFLAYTHSASGHFDAAVEALEESVELIGAFGGDHAQRVWLAMIRKHTGDLDKARHELLDIFSGPTVTSHQMLARTVLADIARFEGGYEEAARQLDVVQSLPMSEDVGVRASYLLGRGLHAVAVGDHESAAAWLQQTYHTAVEMADTPLIAMVVVGLAQLRLRLREPVLAAELFGAAHALRGAADAANPDVARPVLQLRAELGEAGFDEAYGRGRELDRRTALVRADAELATIVSPIGS